MSHTTGSACALYVCREGMFHIDEFAMSLVSEFREFITKGNAVDLAVGVIIGAAFSSVVTSITDGIIRPLIALLAPNPSVGLMLGPLNIGLVISALVNFLLTAAVVFFAIVKPMNLLRRRLEERKQSPPSA